MAKPRKIAPKQLDIVSAIKAEIESLASQVAELMARKVKLEDAVAQYEGRAPKPPAGKALIASNKMSKSNPFYGLNLPQAAAKQLATFTSPQLPQDIWAAMEGQYPSSSKDPVHGLRWALQRRASTDKDVMLVGEGKWAMTAWYTEEERKRIVASLGGMAGRDRANHIEKTKAAIQRMKASGIHFGRKPKMTPEKIAKLRQLIELGMSVKDACKEMDISLSTFAKYRKDMPDLKITKKRRKSRKAVKPEEPDLLDERRIPEAVN